MAGTPERKTHFLGREYQASDIGLVGFFLTMAGTLVANEPRLALPAIAVGLSLLVYSIRKME